MKNAISLKGTSIILALKRGGCKIIPLGNAKLSFCWEVNITKPKTLPFRGLALQQQMQIFHSIRKTIPTTINNRTTPTPTKTVLFSLRTFFTSTTIFPSPQVHGLNILLRLQTELTGGLIPMLQGMSYSMNPLALKNREHVHFSCLVWD